MHGDTLVAWSAIGVLLTGWLGTLTVLFALQRA
jgi:hypothetical protein